MATSDQGKPLRDIAGNWKNGMISIRFMSQMKKNSDIRKGRKWSPRLPSDGRRIWSRTANRATSPRFCTPRGTIFGFQKANQKKTMTAAAQTTAIRSGFVKWKEPMLKIGWKLKSERLGAG